MPEQIYTFTDKEIAKMFKSGQLKLLTTPDALEKTDHEKALEKAKKLFGKDFEDVQTLEIGGKSPDQLKHELQEVKINITNWAMDLLDSPDFATLPNPQNIELIRLKVRDLGFKKEATTEQIYKKTEELGLYLCPAEVGPYLRLKHTDQALGDWYWIAMKQMAGRVGLPDVFALGHDEGGFWLGARWVRPSYRWNPDSRLVFGLSK